MPGSDFHGDADADVDETTDADGAADLEEVVEHVRTQSAEAPGSDTERATIRSLESLDADALRELSAALEGGAAGEGTDPGAIGIYLSPQNGERVLETEGLEEFEPLEERLGRPIRVEEGMPDDAVLVMPSGAVDRDSGELLEPTAVVCGTLGKVR